MALTVAARPPLAAPVLDQLSAVAAGRGLEGLGDRLRTLGELTRGDLAETEAALAEVPRGAGLVGQSAGHLLDLSGKRLRPMCVALAARLGTGFDGPAREFAVAVELVHNATLLHDDVIDLGDLRRGKPTARSIYGNAASIFAGDWLLVEALKRVRRAGVAGTLEALLDVIEEMIVAESAQLANRGRVDTGRAEWLHVVEGKTASLFRWAMFAGARAGGLGDGECAALESFGQHLGVAFQAVDDLLDFTGNARALGKNLFTDLREGKMTWPLIIALEREPSVRPLVEEIVAVPPDEAHPEALVEALLASLHRTGGIEDCRQLARKRAAEAVNSLGPLPDTAARAALETVAVATVSRER